MREAVETALSSAAPALGLTFHPEGSAGWTVSRSDEVRARLALDAGWLCLEGPVELLGGNDSWWDRWLAGAREPGPARLTTAPEVRGVQRRAEVAIFSGELGDSGYGSDAVFVTRVDRLVRSFFGDGDDRPGEPMSWPELADLCREIGAMLTEATGTETPGTETSGPAHSIALPGSERRADRVNVWRESGGIGLALELATVDASISPAARDAIALLLLTVAGMVRLVRAGVSPRSDGTGIRLECRLAGDACAGELDQALGALATARSLCAAELEQLSGDRIARTYLALRAPESTTNPDIE